MLLYPIGSPDVKVTNECTPVQLKDAKNYKFAKSDKSRGIHNTAYAAAILKAAIQEVSAEGM